MTYELQPHEIDEINSLPDAMLLHNIRAIENILANPGQFPHADMAIVQARWAEMVAVGGSRCLVELLAED